MTTARDPWAWLATNCECGCPRVIRTAADLAAVNTAHPEVTQGTPGAGPAPHPDVEWEREIEEGRRTPMAEREHGLIPEEPVI